MIEQQLRETLARKSPPPGFSARVMAAIEHETRAPGRQTSRAWWQWAAAAALLMAIGGGTTAHYIEQRREGERAKEQVLLALRITSAKLRDTRQHVRAIGRQEE